MEKKSAGVAWYDSKGSGWLRDIWVLSHLPYTCWHLSYVLIGAAVVVPELNWSTLGWTVLAFFLGMGIGAHCLDELNGRPLRTKIPTLALWMVAIASIAGAVAIGVFIGLEETIWVLPCILFGGFIVFAYTLEWPRDHPRFGIVKELGLVGFFHKDIFFGIAWGAFPAITAYTAQTHTLSPAMILVAAACLLYSMTQRVLSTQSRFFRRKVMELRGKYYVEGEGSVVPGTVGWNPGHDLTIKDIIGPADLALKFMTWTVVAAAIGLTLLHI